MTHKKRIATAKGRSPEKINDVVAKGRSSTPKNNKSKVKINIVSESNCSVKDAKTNGVLKVVLLGDSQVGKSAFLRVQNQRSLPWRR